MKSNNFNKKNDEFSDIESDINYTKYVWKNADRTQMYRDILYDLISDKDNDYRWDIILAKDEDDYARITIWTNFLWKYIVQMTNDVVSYIWEKHWWEDCEDEIREWIWLSLLKRYEEKESDPLDKQFTD